MEGWTPIEVAQAAMQEEQEHKKVTEAAETKATLEAEKKEDQEMTEEEITQKIDGLHNWLEMNDLFNQEPTVFTKEMRLTIAEALKSHDFSFIANQKLREQVTDIYYEHGTRGMELFTRETKTRNVQAKPEEQTMENETSGVKEVAQIKNWQDIDSLLTNWEEQGKIIGGKYTAVDLRAQVEAAKNIYLKTEDMGYAGRRLTRQEGFRDAVINILEESLTLGGRKS